ncbi:MAG: glycosyltransferase family 1 protein [Chloracidobacterium sp.]|nr:glycosyltransferase family 1 protein [Chloracidobacterium sp.]
MSSYIRAGDEAGYEIALYGRPDSRFPTIRFSTQVGAYDYVVFVVESCRRWMSALRMPRIFAEVPRERRAIVDADGMYNQIVSSDGYDRNHQWEHVRAEWFTHYQIVANKIFQPTFCPREPGARRVLFYGYDPTQQVHPERAPAKAYDILCVGHNWWRWRQVSRELLPEIEKVRPQLGEIGFVGLWWDTIPAGAADLGVEAAFGANPEWLRRLRIRISPSVPYTEVVNVMSSGRINIMTQRPLFRELKILTSKYFEIFCADTTPLIMIDPDHAEMVYGEAGRELALCHCIGEKLVHVLNSPKRYRELVEEVRKHLLAHHSYRNRVQELVAALKE